MNIFENGEHRTDQMKTPRCILLWCAALVLMGFLLNGCSLWHWVFPPEKEAEKGPTLLLSDGMDAMDRGYYQEAIDAFQQITDRYPYSREALTAELKLADAYFARRLFEEAFGAYGDFEKLHPNHPEIPYVIYRMGLCHYERMTSIDRDQEYTLKAKEHFERLISRFPDSPYAQSAKLKVRDCYESLAGHELYVGNFYYKTGRYGAAAGRYEYLIQNYPDLGQYHEALTNLSKSREKLADAPPADETAEPVKKKPAWWNLPARLFD